MSQNVQKEDRGIGGSLIFIYLALQIRGGAAPKVEQNIQKLEKCSTAASKFGPRGTKSRTKIQKIEKMFYRRLQIRPARPRK